MGKETRLVLAFFESEAAADTAAKRLADWAKTNPYARLGAIGVLVRDADGEIKTHKLGPRETRKGAGVGVALGIVAAAASGGFTLLEGVAFGGLGGGGVGYLFKKGLGMTEEDAERIGARLDQGHAAVGALALPEQEDGITRKLEELGGEPEVHEVSDEHLDEHLKEVPAGVR